MESAQTALATAPQVLSGARLREIAKEAGFDLCGFARAERIPSEVLESWLSEGMAAQMAWMHTRSAERLDVRKLLPGAQTVVALACNYYSSDESAPSSPIARYARGRDYHATLKDRLRAMRRTLAVEHPDVRSYASVDTAPVMEKVWAARAGLGYVGRNGCFITEQFGSYVLLATLILDAEVDSWGEGPALDRCGTCRLCVTACPTSAIVADSTVDARRCLSYQTIENRGEAPEELRPALGGIAFGCDICQDICPLNLDPVSAGAGFGPRAVARLSVRELAGLSLEGYQQFVPGTAIARAKYDGLRRNAVYALGAERDRLALPLLRKLCSDASELVRSAARWSIRRLTA